MGIFMANNKDKIKSIFKTAEEARKEAVDLAKKNLEEEPPKVLEEKKKKKKKKSYRNTWARRLFYGPGTLWGAGSGNDSGTDSGGDSGGGDGGGGDGGGG
jgi:hypothetical protein